MKIQISDTASGSLHMIFASFSFSLMISCVYFARVLDPSVSSAVVSFVRVLVNLIILLIPAIFARDIRSLFGDGRASLWLRGLFGGVSLMLFFFAIQSIGMAESTFIQSSNGMFIILLCPLFLSEKFSPSSLFAVAGSLLGLYFLFDPHLGSVHLGGKVIALISGFFAALSSLMVARAGRSNTPSCVVFYFCFVSIFVHIPYFLWYGLSIPSGTSLWLTMSGSGVFASIGQLCMTKAYQLAKVGKMTILGYLSPVFSLAWSVLFFHQLLTFRSFIGCIIIFVCGVFFSLLRKEKTLS